MQRCHRKIARREAHNGRQALRSSSEEHRGSLPTRALCPESPSFFGWHLHDGDADSLVLTFQCAQGSSTHFGAPLTFFDVAQVTEYATHATVATCLLEHKAARPAVPSVMTRRADRWHLGRAQHKGLPVVSLTVRAEASFTVKQRLILGPGVFLCIQVGIRRVREGFRGRFPFVANFLPSSLRSPLETLAQTLYRHQITLVRPSVAAGLDLR
mmetsp:Transcript_30772/g.81780  ORF Transcript_30772/g.81780 Transcript_30772/m.81780 type:complete len:212 (+) Transcript_30772:116-751(+)